MKKSAKYLIIAFLALIVACKPSLPSDVIPEDMMEDILYEIHLSHFTPKDESDELARKVRDDAALMYSRQLQILKKYGVSEDKWENSMKYYARHAELLKGIYDSLVDRITDDATAMGVSIGNGGMQDEDLAALDSTDIWNVEREMLVSSLPGARSVTWKLENVDSVLVDGERLTLSFYTNFLSSFGNKRLGAVFSVRLDNDSIIQQNVMVTSNGARSLSVQCPDDRHVKNISGLFMLYKPSAYESQNLKNAMQVVFINKLRMLHEAPKREQENNDSVKVDSLKTDSLKVPVKDKKVELKKEIR